MSHASPAHLQTNVLFLCLETFWNNRKLSEQLQFRKRFFQFFGIIMKQIIIE